MTSIESKKYVGNNILHVAVWKKSDDHMVYNYVYKDAKTTWSYVKRFSVMSVIKDKAYNLTAGNEGSKIMYFSANPNSEWEILDIKLKDSSKARKINLEYSLEKLSIKGRGSKGNILVKYPIKSVRRKQLGASTLGGIKIWLDDSVGRLNTTNTGTLLGQFNSGDTILVIYNDGSYQMTSYEMTNRYNMKESKLIVKFKKDLVISTLYYNGNNKAYYIKRFTIETSTLMKSFKFISEERGSKLCLISIREEPIFNFDYRLKDGNKKTKSINAFDFIEIKGWKSIGNKIPINSRMSNFSLSYNNMQDLPKTEADVDESQSLSLFD